MSILLILGTMNLNAQVEPVDDRPGTDERPCASLAQVKQTCNEDGTVTITFQVSNNSLCKVKGVTITPNDGGIGQSYAINIAPQQVSGTTITYTSSNPGTTLCFDIILHGSEGRECCRSRACIKVKTCCGLKAKLHSTGGCPPNGWARVIVSGGTPPYSSNDASQFGFQGNFVATGLDEGTHVLTFMDSDSCVVEITVDIEPCCSDEADCGDFNAISGLANQSGITNEYVEVISEIDATLIVRLDADCVPDGLVVSVNGDIVVNIEAGTHACNGTTNEIAVDTFCVSVCDEIVFEVLSDICNGGASNGCANWTSWNWQVTSCNEGCDNVGTARQVVEIESRSMSNEGTDFLSEDLQGVMVYPNPINDVINISYSDNVIEYHTARIINSSGQLIHSENISNRNQVQIDASTFLRGIYIIEMTDNYGKTTIEKFMKL